MSISSFHQRPQYQLHDDNTHCGSSLQSLRNIFSWRNFNLEPDHFSSQSVPHRNRINHPRLRTTLLKPSYWLHHPENQYRRPHTLQIVHIVRPLCLLTSTSIRPLRGLMRDGTSHAALHSHFSIARPPCASSSSLLLPSFSLSLPLGPYLSLHFLMSSVHIFPLVISLNLNPIRVEPFKILTG